jgi:hypothetical protein
VEERNLERSEASVEIYLGPDLSARLDAIETDIRDLARTEPEAATKLLNELRNAFTSHDRKWRPWLVCSVGPCQRHCDPTTGCKEEVETTQRKTNEWLIALRRDFAQRDLHLSVLSSLSPSELRKRATFTVWCADCRQMIACVLQVDARPLLLVRRRSGGLEPTVWLDGVFWGDIAYCRRKQFALHVAALGNEIAGGARKWSLRHAQKSGEL